MNILKINLLIISLLSLSAFQKQENNKITPMNSIPEVITISEKGLYPEGIEFDHKTGQFIVGAMAKSEVGRIDPKTGGYTTFITDENLAGVTGVLTDEKRNRLLVISGDLGFSTNSKGPGSTAYLGIYNLETGERIKGVDLKTLFPQGTPVFANDIAIDPNGNIYVTDSFAPVIYKVDSTSFEASIFVNGTEQFTPAPNGFGLNGIIYANGNLIAGKTDNGFLFKIPVSNPTGFTKIEAPAFVGVDGLELTKDGKIALVENSLGDKPGVHLLTSSDDWKRATLEASYEVSKDKFPTTAALANDGEVYVINAYLSKALNGDLSQDSFSIVKTNW